MKAYVPQRGDLVCLSFDSRAGSEQSGRRPALVLSPGNYNERVGLMLCCPVTARKKGYPFEVELEGNGHISGVVLADHLKSLDWRARKAAFQQNVAGRIVAEVLAKSRVLLEA